MWQRNALAVCSLQPTSLQQTLLFGCKQPLPAQMAVVCIMVHSTGPATKCLFFWHAGTNKITALQLVQLIQHSTTYACSACSRCQVGLADLHVHVLQAHVPLLLLLLSLLAPAAFCTCMLRWRSLLGRWLTCTAARAPTTDAFSCLMPAPQLLQAEEFFSQHAKPGRNAQQGAEAQLSKRLAQLPRPVMAGRSSTSVTVNVDRRGNIDADMQVGLLRLHCLLSCCFLLPTRCLAAAPHGP